LGQYSKAYLYASQLYRSANNSSTISMLTISRLTSQLTTLQGYSTTHTTTVV
jgi:hypothetical protein